MGRIKVVGIPGGKPKIEEKARISKGSMQKMGNSREVAVNLTGNPGGGYNFFFLKSPFIFNTWKRLQLLFELSSFNENFKELQ